MKPDPGMIAVANPRPLAAQATTSQCGINASGNAVNAGLSAVSLPAIAANAQAGRLRITTSRSPRHAHVPVQAPLAASGTSITQAVTGGLPAPASQAATLAQAKVHVDTANAMTDLSTLVAAGATRGHDEDSESLSVLDALLPARDPATTGGAAVASIHAISSPSITSGPADGAPELLKSQFQPTIPAGGGGQMVGLHRDARPIIG